MHEDVLDLVGLLDADADAGAVDARLDQHALALIARHVQRVQGQLRGRPRLDLGHVVPLRRLGGEVGERERGGERGAHAGEVGAERLGLARGEGGSQSRDGGCRWRGRGNEPSRLRRAFVEGID